MPMRFDQSIVCPVAVGRETLLGALDRLIDQARGGSGQVALVTGEAGIGKSRLVAQAQARAAPLGMRIVEGRCYENDAALPYAPCSTCCVGSARFTLPMNLSVILA